MDPLSGLLRHLDSDLQKFYSNVLHNELDAKKKKNSLKIRQALKEVVDAYRKEVSIDVSPSIRFDTPAKRYAYVLKHSPCFTSAVAKHFSRLVRSNPGILQGCFRSGRLNLCCLGGGPASDAVAVCTVVSALHRVFWTRTRRTLEFNVTIVDINEDWESTARNVIDILKVADDFCHVQGMKLSFNFCQADLTQPLKQNVEKALCKADIVTMVYFLSAVNRRKDTEESRYMIRKIMTRLPKGSFIFFLDSAHDLNYIQMSEEADSLARMTQIYRPQLEYLHTLSLNSVKTFLEIHREDFGRLLCMTHCFVSVGAWISMGDILDIVGLPRIDILKINKGKLCSKFDDLQKASRLTRRMLDYRAKVHKLMASKFDGSQSESGFEDDDEENDPSENWIKRFSEFVPEYFFQTKIKKRRIFNGPPLSI